MLEVISTYSGSYDFAKFIIQRALASIYLLAFINALNQFPALLGENGLLPLPNILPKLTFRRKPSIFNWFYSDRFFRFIVWIGISLSIVAISGLADMGPFWVTMIVWLLVWLIYLSIVNVGLVFYGFGWESMLLEAGFYAIFLGPASWSAPIMVIWIYCWMVFRVEFGAGLIKMRGDPCWRKLSCLNYHHETQPMPNPLSWFFHQLPESLHKMETLGNHTVQLVLVWGLFFPQPIAAFSAGAIILTQSYLILSGNYSWLNWLTIILAISGISDSVVHALFGIAPIEAALIPSYFKWLTLFLSFIVIYLSFEPIKNMLSSNQKMNLSFNPLHLVNTYGAFGSVTKQRYEVIIEGTSDLYVSADTDWKEYDFKGKPGDVKRCPPVVSPYHLRLDWQLWFAALSPRPNRHSWFLPLVEKLLQNDEAVLGLIRKNPFPDNPPKFVRARLFRYRFTSIGERRITGNWWKREFVQPYLMPRSVSGPAE